MNRNDEGNTSSQLPRNTNSSEMYNEIQKADIDKISMIGEYKDKLLVVGVDLRNKVVSVTMKSSDAELIDEIEELLML